MKSKKKASKLLILAAVLVVIIVGVLVFMAQRSADNEVIENAGEVVSTELQTVLHYGDKSVTLKKHLNYILAIGIDRDGTQPVYEEGSFIPFYNRNQADFLGLIVVDNSGEVIDIIQINRDTMMDVPWTDVLGYYGGTEFQQICLSFNSGSGREDSCENVVKTVSSLLFDLPIDHYFCFTMSGIGTLTDLVGGVEVEIRDDLTELDESYVKGAKVVLYGDKAEDFVRARMELTNDTNTARMARQRDFFDGFLVSARRAFDSDNDFALKAVKKLSAYLISDMSADQLSDLATRVDKYQVNAIHTPNGELTIGEQYYEFYVDHDDLWNIVCETMGDKS